jgi:hypothetical protein
MLNILVRFGSVSCGAKLSSFSTSAFGSAAGESAPKYTLFSYRNFAYFYKCFLMLALWRPPQSETSKRAYWPAEHIGDAQRLTGNSRLKQPPLLEYPTCAIVRVKVRNAFCETESRVHSRAMKTFARSCERANVGGNDTNSIGN